MEFLVKSHCMRGDPIVRLRMSVKLLCVYKIMIIMVAGEKTCCHNVNYLNKANNDCIHFEQNN